MTKQTMRHGRQIATKILPKERVWSEFRSVLATLRSTGITEAEILFGFPWAIEIYPTAEWTYIRLPLQEIEAKVRLEGSREKGSLGRDDLFLRPLDRAFELQFCHESDIHIWFTNPSPLVLEIAADWQTKMFEPRELVKEGDRLIPKPIPPDQLT